MLLIRRLSLAQQAAVLLFALFVILFVILALLLRRSLSTVAPGDHAPQGDVALAVAVAGEHRVDVPAVAAPRLSASPDIPRAGQRCALDLSDRVGVRALLVVRVIHVEVIVLGVRIRPDGLLLLQCSRFL